MIKWCINKLQSIDVLFEPFAIFMDSIKQYCGENDSFDTLEEAYVDQFIIDPARKVLYSKREDVDDELFIKLYNVLTTKFLTAKYKLGSMSNTLWFEPERVRLSKDHLKFNDFLTQNSKPDRIEGDGQHSYLGENETYLTVTQSLELQMRELVPDGSSLQNLDLSIVSFSEEQNGMNISSVSLFPEDLRSVSSGDDEKLSPQRMGRK